MLTIIYAPVDLPLRQQLITDLELREAAYAITVCANNTYLEGLNPTHRRIIVYVAFWGRTG